MTCRTFLAVNVDAAVESTFGFHWPAFGSMAQKDAEEAALAFPGPILYALVCWISFACRENEALVSPLGFE